MQGFEELQRMYRGALREKRALLAQDWDALCDGAEPEAHALSLRRQLHQLSGSAGAYGYDAMGEMARDLEKRWVQWLALPAAKRSDAQALCSELGALMLALQTALEDAALPPEPGG